MKNNALIVKLWGADVGYLVWDSRQNVALFEYEPSFVKSGLDIAPTTMSIHSLRSEKGVAWTGNSDKLYHGLPPILADSLPDRWGDSVFNSWLLRQGIKNASITPVDRLSYIGSRGMGALEYAPAQKLGVESFDVDVAKLYDFARQVASERSTESLNAENILWQDLIKIGTSAGGKRPKAIVALNDSTGEVRSGQTDIPDGFHHYILKFGDASGYPATKIEYVYWQMAGLAGIEMMPSILRQWGGITHFLTERFDRKGSEKIHTQTVAAMMPEATDYNDIFALLRTLRLPYADHEQLFRTMVFNVIARNVDDHNKNFSLTMSRDGVWRLAPAYDLTFSVDLSAPAYVNRHSLTIGGKADDITDEDIAEIAAKNEIAESGVIISQVRDAVSQFSRLAQEVEVEREYADPIAKALKQPGNMGNKQTAFVKKPSKGVKR